MTTSCMSNGHILSLHVYLVFLRVRAKQEEMFFLLQCIERVYKYSQVMHLDSKLVLTLLLNQMEINKLTLKETATKHGYNHI